VTKNCCSHEENAFNNKLTTTRLRVSFFGAFYFLPLLSNCCFFFVVVDGLEGKRNVKKYVREKNNPPKKTSLKVLAPSSVFE
jgi:hypothetical protein